MIDQATESQVRELAGDACEYCRLPQHCSPIPLLLDHVIPRKHVGGEIKNLALICGRCNLHKGAIKGGIDPATKVLTRLFHPRKDKWPDHFRFEGLRIVGKTDVGRTTVIALGFNDDDRLKVRYALLLEGAFPPALPPVEASKRIP